jgi:hypothetical protein
MYIYSPGWGYLFMYLIDLFIFGWFHLAPTYRSYDDFPVLLVEGDLMCPYVHCFVYNIHHNDDVLGWLLLLLFICHRSICDAVNIAIHLCVCVICACVRACVRVCPDCFLVEGLPKLFKKI